MTKDYDLPKGRRITADFDENGITKVTVQALDSLIGELNCYADKVCDIEQIRAEIEHWESDDTQDEYQIGAMDMQNYVLRVIDKYAEQEPCDDAMKVTKKVRSRQNETDN